MAQRLEMQEAQYHILDMFHITIHFFSLIFEWHLFITSLVPASKDIGL